MRTPGAARARRPSRLPIVVLGLALVALAGFGWSHWRGPDEDARLRASVALLDAVPPDRGLLLPVMGDPRPLQVATAARAIRQLGLDPVDLHSFGPVIAAALAATGPGEPDFPFQAFSDVRYLESNGDLVPVAVPSAARASIAELARASLRAVREDDESSVSDTVVVVRAARDVGAGDGLSSLTTDACSIAGAQLGAGQLDAAALVAEIASDDPRACLTDAAAEAAWRAALERAATDPSAHVNALAFLGRALLPVGDRQAAAGRLLDDLEGRAESGSTIALREIELASRLVATPVDPARFGELVRLLRRQASLDGALPDGVQPGPWDGVIASIAAHRLGLDGPPVAVATEAQPAAGAGIPTELALTSGVPHVVAPGDASLDALDDLPGARAALVLRTQDCRYASPTLVRSSDDAASSVGGFHLLGLNLDAAAVRRCADELGIADDTVQRLTVRALAADEAVLTAPSGATPDGGDVSRVWGAAEGSCALGSPLASRDVLGQWSSHYLAQVAGGDVGTVYRPDDLAAALRLRELAAAGCNANTWWMGR